MAQAHEQEARDSVSGLDRGVGEKADEEGLSVVLVDLGTHVRALGGVDVDVAGGEASLAGPGQEDPQVRSCRAVGGEPFVGPGLLELGEQDVVVSQSGEELADPADLVPGALRGSDTCGAPGDAFGDVVEHDPPPELGQGPGVVGMADLTASSSACWTSARGFVAGIEQTELDELSAHDGRRSLGVEPGNRGRSDRDVAAQHRLEEPAGDAVAQPLAGGRTAVDEPGANRGGELGPAVPVGGAAAIDPAITAALDRIHTEPARPWTIETLAAEAGLSRAALVRRFTALVGEPPASYRTRWRLATAARRLRSSTEPLAVIARDVGYSSEFTFSRAFQRTFGQAPGRYRAEARRRAMK